jgi:hypothetical protein
MIATLTLPEFAGLLAAAVSIAILSIIALYRSFE